MPSLKGKNLAGIGAVLSKRRLLLVFILLVAAACANGPVMQSDTEPQDQVPKEEAPPAYQPEPETQATLDLGQAMLLRGSYSEAQAYYRKAEETAQHSVGKARAFLGSARVEVAQGRLKQASEILKQAAALKPSGVEALQADWLEAVILNQEGNRSGAAYALRRFAASPLMNIPLGEQAQAASYLASELSQGRGDQALLGTLLFSARKKGSLAARDLPPWIALAASRIPAGTLANLVKVEPDKEMQAALIAGLSRSYLRAGDTAGAKQAANYLAALKQGGSWQPWIEAVHQDLERGPRVEPRSVGVLLPLSGPQADKGRRALLAIKLALGIIQAPDKALALHAMDSRSDPVTADRAVRELVERHHVAMIIGPLDTMAALAAARRAQSLETPIICLNGDPGLAKIGAVVFRNHPLPEDQIGAVMPRAVNEGASLVAMLAPNNGNGRQFAQALQAWLEARSTSQKKIRTLMAGQGIRMSPPEFYGTGGGDWLTALDKLLRLPAGESTQAASEARRAVINFDRLWLPGPSEDVQRLVPRLLQYGVRGGQLLGANTWHDPKFLKAVGKLLDGAIFSDAFDPASNREETRAFSQSFQRESSQEPGLLEALAYDSALVMKTVMEGAGPTGDRQKLLLALNRLRGVAGACGDLEMGLERRLRAPMKLFRISQGRFESLGPASQN